MKGELLNKSENKAFRWAEISINIRIYIARNVQENTNYLAGGAKHLIL